MNDKILSAINNLDDNYKLSTIKLDILRKIRSKYTMPIGPDSKLIQVVISKTTYEYLKNYSHIFNCSISEFCNQAICTRILKDNNIQLGDEHKCTD